MDKIVAVLDEKYDITPFEEIRSKYVKTGVTVENITLLILKLMNEANKLKNMTGSDKKKLVIDILRVTIEEAVSDDILEMVLKEMVPVLIDKFIDISKGVDLKKFKSWCVC